MSEGNEYYYYCYYKSETVKNLKLISHSSTSIQKLL